MTKKKTVIRGVVNSVLLAAIVTLGVCVYQSGNEKDREKKLAKEEEIQQEEEMLDAGTSKVQADMDNRDGEDESEEDATLLDKAQEVPEETVIPKETQKVENVPDTAPSDSTSVQAAPQPAFTESSLMVWPLSGDILMDYSMDKSIYDPTLKVYRYNPGIVIGASPEAPVLSAAAGTIASIVENEETGTTVTVDLGNGYQATYGQLHNLEISEGQAVEQSTILGSVANPTKYYTVEGANLYFAMTKDNKPVDPISYLP